MDETRFRAMGSDVHVAVIGGTPRLVEEARRRIAVLESRWSRFIPGSEVSRLVGAGGRPVAVSADTRLLVSLAVEAWHRTAGAFDPTVLGAMVRAGYDRTFDDVAAHPAAGDSDLTFGCGDIEVDGDTVRVPLGVGFDPGGIGKGLAADLVAGEALADGAAGVCVNIGGDLRVAGEGPGDGDGAERGAGGGWTVAVEHPARPAPLAVLGVTSGAVATSATLRRAWVVGGRPAHHLIDPATGRPTEGEVVLATVVASHAWMAEALATAVVVRGASGLALVEAAGADALAVTSRGVVRGTPGLGRFLGGRSLPDHVDGPPATVAAGAAEAGS